MIMILCRIALHSAFITFLHTRCNKLVPKHVKTVSQGLLDEVIFGMDSLVAYRNVISPVVLCNLLVFLFLLLDDVRSTEYVFKNQLHKRKKAMEGKYGAWGMGK